MYLRLNDTRTQAAHYIAENIAPGTTVGMVASISEKYPWRFHKWRYPVIDFSRYEEVHFLNKPDILILNSEDFLRMGEALKSDKLKKGYVWDEDYNNEWYRFSPPPPVFFQFYDEILYQEGEYTMLKAFKKNNFIPLEAPSPEIRIYQRI